jgi:hypothetical protein
MPTLRVIFPGRGGGEVLRDHMYNAMGGGPPSESEGGHLAAARRFTSLTGDDPQSYAPVTAALGRDAYRGAPPLVGGV